MLLSNKLQQQKLGRLFYVNVWEEIDKTLWRMELVKQRFIILLTKSQKLTAVLSETDQVVL
jgi:hypothetical protein